MTLIRHRRVLPPTRAVAGLPPYDWNDDHEIVGDAASGAVTVRRTLTSPELKALHTTPIVLVGGLPGQILAPVIAIAYYRNGGINYTGARQLIVTAPTGGGGFWTWYCQSDFLNGPSWIAILNQDGAAAPPDMVVGQPLVAKLDGGAVLAGNGEVDLTVRYVATTP